MTPETYRFNRPRNAWSASDPVGADDHARRRDRGAHQLERPRLAVLEEEALASTEQDRLHHQLIGVDEIVLDEEPRHARAAHDVEIVPRLRLQLAQRSDDVV